MSDGHGCDSGGCLFDGTIYGDVGAALAPDGRTPIPNIKQTTINGAPVSEASHEYLIRQNADRTGQRRSVLKGS